MCFLTFGVPGLNFEEFGAAQRVCEQVEGKELHVGDGAIGSGPEEGVLDRLAAEASSELNQSELLVNIL